MPGLPHRLAGLAAIALLVGSYTATAQPVSSATSSQRPSRLITTVVDGRTVQTWGPDERGLLPVRVGGALRPPQKISSAPLVYPEDAKAAGVQGVVIIEALVGIDGTVQDARVLRSIPLGQMATPGETANLVAFVASDEASAITGASLAADGGLSVMYES